MIDTCLVEEGLGIRPKAQLTLWYMVRTPSLPLTWKHLCINRALVADPESKGSELAELCSAHMQPGSRAAEI